MGSIPTRPTRPGPPVACDLRKRLVMGRVLPAWLCGCARLGVAVCGWLRQMRGQSAAWVIDDGTLGFQTLLA